MTKEEKLARKQQRKAEKVGLGKLLLWNSSSCSVALSTLMLGYATFYCTDVLQLAPALVGTLFMVSKIFDSFTDIVAGFIVDRTQTRWGKGRPYEIFMLFLWLSTWLLFSCPTSFATAAKCIWIFCMYTDADSVEIFINGKSAGKAQVKDYFAKIPCIYEPGELVGVGYDADGQEIYRTSVHTADAETVLTVKTDKNILRAGGQDFCFADVYVTDKNGTVKLLPDYDVKIEVVGAASLQGYGSAAYKNAEHYDQHHHKSWQGHLQAVLRSTEKTGPVTVTFTADGCAPAILHLSAE